MIVYTCENGQKQPSSHSWTELSKTQFFFVSIVKKESKCTNFNIQKKPPKGVP